jgi:hypothetical protein
LSSRKTVETGCGKAAKELWKPATGLRVGGCTNSLPGLLETLTVTSLVQRDRRSQA